MKRQKNLYALLCYTLRKIYCNAKQC